MWREPLFKVGDQVRVTRHPQLFQGRDINASFTRHKEGLGHVGTITRIRLWDEQEGNFHHYEITECGTWLQEECLELVENEADLDREIRALLGVKETDE